MGDGIFQDAAGCAGEPNEGGFGDCIGGLRWRDTGSIQNFAGVEIADSRDEFLIEQGDLDGSCGARQGFAPLRRGDFQRVGTETTRQHVPLLRGVKTDRAKAPTVPEPEIVEAVRPRFREPPDRAEMLDGGGIGQEHETGHAGFNGEKSTG